MYYLLCFFYLFCGNNKNIPKNQKVNKLEVTIEIHLAGVMHL